MLCVLSGGTGTPKLLQGLKDIFELSVIVNTAEDIWISGNKVCPDIDSVIYSLSNIIDTEKWWGVAGDTFKTYHRLKELGIDENLMIGDIDRATHIIRSEYLRRGYSLTEATKELCKRHNVSQKIFPMCDEDVSSIIKTPKGIMHFQEFWITHRGKVNVFDVEYQGVKQAKMTKEVKKAIKMCKAVLIGPSNPITSIFPILSIKGIKELLMDKKVIAISPIIGRKPFSGPADKLMKAKGYDISPEGVSDCYNEFLDILVVDKVDKHLEGNKTIENKNGDKKIKVISIVSTSILMKNREDAVNLSKFIEELV